MIINSSYIQFISLLITLILVLLIIRTNFLSIIPAYTFLFSYFVQDIRFDYLGLNFSASSLLFLISFFSLFYEIYRNSNLLKINYLNYKIYLFFLVISIFVPAIIHKILWNQFPQDYLRSQIWSIWGLFAIMIDYKKLFMRRLYLFSLMTLFLIVLLSYPQSFLFSLFTSGGGLGRFTLNYSDRDLNFFKSLYLIVISKSCFWFQLETKPTYLVQILVGFCAPVLIYRTFQKSYFYCFFVYLFFSIFSYLNQYLLMLGNTTIIFAMTLFYLKFNKKISNKSYLKANFLIFLVFIFYILTPSSSVMKEARKILHVNDSRVNWEPEPLLTRFSLVTQGKPNEPSLTRISLMQISLKKMFDNNYLFSGSGASKVINGKLIFANNKNIDLKTDHSFIIDNFFQFGLIGGLASILPILYVFYISLSKLLKMNIIYWSFFQMFISSILLMIFGTFGITHVQNGIFIIISILLIKMNKKYV